MICTTCNGRGETGLRRTPCPDCHAGRQPTPLTAPGAPRMTHPLQRVRYVASAGGRYTSEHAPPAGADFTAWIRGADRELRETVRDAIDAGYDVDQVAAHIADARGQLRGPAPSFRLRRR